MNKSAVGGVSGAVVVAAASGVDGGSWLFLEIGFCLFLLLLGLAQWVICAWPNLSEFVPMGASCIDFLSISILGIGWAQEYFYI